MSEIPNADWTWIDAAANRFEQEWKKGNLPRIEDYLTEVDESRRPLLLEELMRVEHELLPRLGIKVDRDDYLRRFPDSAAVINAVFAPEPGLSEATSARLPGREPRTTGRTTSNEDANSEQELAAGTHVRYFGDYELIREIGRGGMAIVYKARQISLNRSVALKMIRSAALASEDELRRFQNEAEAVALLDHLHIVPILEVGNHDGQRYFSMKLIAGSSLDKKLIDYARDPKSAAALLTKAAEAVHHAHQRGILHRDLKPANIVLDEHGQAYVTDFGLAKRTGRDSELSESGAIMGTPAFMAPEQASGRRGAVTTSSDVYGLGAVLYALLTGRAPFGGDSVEQILEQVRSALPALPSKINPRAPRDLDVISLKCLEKEPARRYVSALALAEDLGRYLAGEPIMARPTGALERGWLWCKRNPWLAGALSSVAAALVAVAVLSVLYARGQARSRKDIAVIAKDLKKSLVDSEALGQKLQTSLVTSSQRLAVLHFERGQLAFRDGQISPGLLEMIETWRSAVAAGDPDWQRIARANLAAWQSHNIRTKAVFSHESTGGAVPFSPDGKLILKRACDSTARLWDAATGKPIAAPPTHKGRVETFSPNGKVVLTLSDDKTGRLWDTVTGQPIGAPLTHQGGAARFSPDGKVVLVGGPDDTARLWNAATGQSMGTTLTHQGGAVTFSPDSRVVLTRSRDNTSRLWDINTGKMIGAPLTHQGEVVAFSPNSKVVLTFSDDNTPSWAAGEGTAQLWDTASGK